MVFRPSGKLTDCKDEQELKAKEAMSCKSVEKMMSSSLEHWEKA
jgi:hypothetical protein